MTNKINKSGLFKRLIISIDFWLLVAPATSLLEVFTKVVEFSIFEVLQNQAMNDTENKDLGFTLVWMEWFSRLYKSAGSKASVVSELLIRMDARDNTFTGTSRDIGEKSGVSHPVVIEVIKTLEKDDMIRKVSHGRYMISPLAICKGNTRKRGLLMKKYELYRVGKFVMEPNTEF